MKFMILSLYGNGPGASIAPHDSATHHEFQIADPLQKKRPAQGQFDRAGWRQQTVGFKKNAAAAYVEGPAHSKVFYTTLVEQFVLKLQSNGIATIPALVARKCLYRRDPVFIIGQAFGVFVYLRNMQFVLRSGGHGAAA